MKIGDLVTLRWGEGKRAAGIIVETYQSGGNDRYPAYKEVRVQWLDDGGQDVSWVIPKDLEIVSENR